MKNDKQPRWQPWSNNGICLQRDRLDLYVDDVLVDSAPINYNGMERLKDVATSMMQSGMLFQIKIRHSVQWESTPTQIEDEPEGGWPKVYDRAVM